MWFRNLCLFRLDGAWTLTPGTLEEALRAHPLASCTGMNERTRGWVSPRDDEEYVVALGPHLLIALGEERKLLPASIVNQAARDRARELEQQNGYAPGRKQLRQLKEQLTAELLPRALARRRTIRAWIDTQAGWLVVDSAAPALAEDLVELLREIPGLPRIVVHDTDTAPTTGMTKWLATGHAPGRFTIDDECELRGSDATRSVVRYVRHALDGEEIRRHISAGKQVGRLALTWNERVSFVLTDIGQLKRVSLIDVDADTAEVASENDAEQFDADFTLMTGEMGPLLEELSAALDTPLRTG